MCGIIFAESFIGAPVNKLVLKQYDDQKHRGQEGFGTFDRTRTKLMRATKERKIISTVANHPTSSLLFHHRFPTSTDNVKNACHPFSTKNFFDVNYVLIHNGHIRNSRDLKKEHEALGIEYYSQQADGRFNDSEALLWDVALYLEGKQDKLKAYGNIAFICLALPRDGRKPSKLHFARNSNNPMNMVLDSELIMLSSEGEGEEVPVNTLHTYSYKTKKLETAELQVPSNAPYTGNYDYSTNSDWASSWEDNDDFASYYKVPKLPYSSGGLTNFVDGGYSKSDDEILDELEEEATKDHHFFLLPNDGDYSYGTVIKMDRPEIVLERENNKVLNVISTIGDRLEVYLEGAEGVYWTAFGLVKFDAENFTEQLREDRERGLQDDEDLLLEIDLLNATKLAILTSPWFVSRASVDPDFKGAYGGREELIKDVAQSFLSLDMQRKVIDL